MLIFIYYLKQIFSRFIQCIKTAKNIMKTATQLFKGTSNAITPLGTEAILKTRNSFSVFLPTSILCYRYFFSYKYFWSESLVLCWKRKEISQEGKKNAGFRRYFVFSTIRNLQKLSDIFHTYTTYTRKE